MALDHGSDPFANDIGRVRLAGDRLPDGLHQGKERNAFAVWRAATAHSLGLGPDRREKFVDEARFARASRTQEREELARLVEGRLLEGRGDLPQLAFPTHERRIETLRMNSGGCRDAEQPVRPDRPGRRQGCVRHRPPNDGVRRLGDQDLAGPGRLGQTGGVVDGVTREERPGIVSRARHDLARADPDPDRDHAGGLALTVVQSLEPIAQRGSGAHGPQGVILVEQADTERRDQRVAHRSLDGAAMQLEDLAQRVHEASGRATRRFRVERLRRICRSPDFRVDGRDRAARGVLIAARAPRASGAAGRGVASRGRGRRRGVARRDRETQRRIVAEDGVLHRLEFRSWLHAELAVEHLSSLAIDIERLGLSARSIERQHQAGLECLAQGHLRDEAPQVRHELEVPARGQLGIDSQLERERSALFEAGALRSGASGREVVQRGTAPQVQRCGKSRARRIGDRRRRTRETPRRRARRMCGGPPATHRGAGGSRSAGSRSGRARSPVAGPRREPRACAERSRARRRPRAHR